jgi:hypothetical protein
MIEQCKCDSGYVTVYRGSRVELVAAGVPEAAFSNKAEFPLQTLNACCTGSQEMLSGSMRATDAGFELEVDWGRVRPYVQCSHPAIMELARMLLIDVGYWARDWRKRWSDIPDLSYPIDALIADERAKYKPRPGAPRLQVSPEFHKKLSEYGSYLYQAVYTDCEVLPMPDAAVAQPPRPSSLRLVVDNAKVADHG